LTAAPPGSEDRTSSKDWVLVMIAIFGFAGSAMTVLTVWFYFITWY
jgi:hypothetical protein